MTDLEAIRAEIARIKDTYEATTPGEWKAEYENAVGDDGEAA